MKEEWSIWTPSVIPVGNYELIKLQQDWNGMGLVFEDDNIRVEISYKEELLAFRSCDEGDRWRTVDEILREKGYDFLKNKLLFKVESSEFKEWYVKEGYHVRNMNEFEHHAFVTGNDIVDVLALTTPKIKTVRL